MNHFHKLIIENFQSHQYTEIQFSRGLNVFVGPSDSGKSAILRALRWVLFNTPRGTDFIRTGANYCRVSLIFTDRTEIIRFRSLIGKKENQYILRKPGCEEEKYEGFGNTVPQEITSAHHIEPLKIDHNEMLIHYGTQLESPFLLFESAGSKAKMIGRISGAHLIDNALKKTSADRQNINSEIKQLEQQSAYIKEKLQPFENLPQLEEALERAECMFQLAKEKQLKQGRLQEILQKHLMVKEEQQVQQELIQKLENLPLLDRIVLELERKNISLSQLTRLREKWLQVEQGKKESLQKIEQSNTLPEIEQKLSHLEEKRARLMQYQQIYAKWISNQGQREQVEAILQKCARVPDADKLIGQFIHKIERLKSLSQVTVRLISLKRAQQEVNHTIQLSQQVPYLVNHTIPKLEQKLARFTRLKEAYTKRTELTLRIKKGKQFCQEKEQEIAVLTNEWVALLQQLKKCPTCGSPIKASVIEHIMEEYRGGISHAAAGREN